MADIFSGMSAENPMEIRQALGRCKSYYGPNRDELVGAIMTLCLTVAVLEVKIKKIEKLVRKDESYPDCGST